MREKLISRSKADYGKDYEKHCLEIYRIYVNSADAISARRQNANSFFLTVNTALIGVMGYVFHANIFAIAALGIAGIALCHWWYRLILSYKQMNSGKFLVIHEIEKELPLAPYDAEWIALGKGKNPRIYKPFTEVEMKIPWIFIFLYAAAILFFVGSWSWMPI